MSRSKRTLTADPFLQSLVGRDPRQALTRHQACGFLNIGTTKLDKWRTDGRRPPSWFKEGRDIFYRLGELLAYIEEREKEAMAEKATAPAPLPRTAPQRIQSKRPLVTKRQQDVYGLHDPILRGGPRKGVKHNNFPQFLAAGAPADEWVFLMVPDAHGGAYRRPVDLVATLDMAPAQLRGAESKQLTLAEYGERLSLYLAHAASQELSAERAKQAITHTPKSSKKRKSS